MIEALAAGAIQIPKYAGHQGVWLGPVAPGLSCRFPLLAWGG